MSKRIEDSVNDLAEFLGRSQLPESLWKSSGMARLEYILSHPEPTEFVQSLATEEFYLLIRDIGRQDAYALLEFASDEQLGGIMDLDLWRNHEVVPMRWLSWLEQAQAVNFETALRWINNTETPLLTMLFMGEITVHDKELDTSTVPDELLLLSSPDGAFWVTIDREHPRADGLNALMKLCWAANLERMHQVFTASRFELASPLEESMGHFRRARLEDLGFPGPKEAAEIFTYQNPQELHDLLREQIDDGASVRPWSEGVIAQDLVLRGLTPPPMLARALASLDDQARAHWAQACTYLVNKVFMATTGDLSRVDALPDAGQRALASITIGLEEISGASEELAQACVKHVWPEQLFRLGHSLSVTLCLRARRVRSRAGATIGFDLFGAPIDDALSWVSQAQPRYYEGLEGGASILARPFKTLAEIHQVDALITRCEGILDYFKTRMGFSIEALQEAPLGLDADGLRRIRLSTLLRTGIAQLLLSDELRFVPLSRDDLVAFLTLGLQAGTLNETLAEALTLQKTRMDPSVAQFFDDAIAELVEAFGQVASDDIDPSYASELFLVKR